MRKVKYSSLASYKYNTKHIWRVNFGFNIKTDRDIILKLQSVGNKQGYIKDLIRKDIQNEENKKGN